MRRCSYLIKQRHNKLQKLVKNKGACRGKLQKSPKVENAHIRATTTSARACVRHSHSRAVENESVRAIPSAAEVGSRSQ